MIDDQVYPYSGNLPWLRERTILLVTHGSHAYGLNTPTSDIDLKGVAIPPREYLMGFSQGFEQAESKDPYDMVVYEIRKFFTLAADCNPNIIEVLWADESTYRVLTPLGRRLVDARAQFLSRKARFTFAGYAHAQLKRIQLHYRWLKTPPTHKPTRAEFELPERTLIPADQLAAAQAAIQKKLNAWNLEDMSGIDPASRIAIQNTMAAMLAEMKVSTDEAWQGAARTLGYDENFIALLDRERRYTGRQREWEQFESWKANRNPKRAEMEAKYGYDCYTDDTEFLTEAGWKSYDQISAEDRLATVFVNQSGLAMGHRTELGVEYQPYVDRFEGRFSGDLYRFHGTHLDLLVTPNHRMLIEKQERRSGKRGSWTLQEAALLPDTFNVLRTITPRKATFSNKSLFEDLPIPPEAYLRLMGWYLSDGTLSVKGDTPKDVRISQKKGGKLHGSLQKFANRYGEQTHTSLYAYRRAPNQLRKDPMTELVLCVRDPILRDRISEDCGRTESKRIPRWVFSLSKRLMQILFDAMFKGDGTTRKTSLKSLIYYSSLKPLADDVQELALLCGWETSLYGPYESNGATMYQVHINKNADQRKTMVRSANVEKVTAKEQRIVCFTVPNGTLIVRRKGHVAFHGNSKHGMHLVRLMKMCKEIMETGHVQVKRPDREELLAIRNGAWSYEQLIEWASEQDKSMDALYKSSTLPHSPDRKALDALCVSLVEDSLRG